MALEDTYKFTREEVLRELELLPIWKLRVPLPATTVADSSQPALIPDTESKLAEVEPIVHSLIENTVAITTVLVFSEDKKWIFVLPAVLTGQSADLFNNILRALKIKPAQTAHTKQLAQDIAESGASVVVAMGEIAAQQLLSSTQSIENLRGKMHLVNGMQAIVTYHPDELLQNLPNKAKTWDDLCMALSVLNA
ncbi:MAG: uracil-DNA glycosylase family protein [Pseudomonadota bacterium]